MPASRPIPKPRAALDLAVVLAIAGLFAAPYLTSFDRPVLQGRLHYLLPDALILFVAFLRFRGDTLRRLGLAIPTRDLIRSALLLAVGLGVVAWLMREITASGQVQVTGHLQVKGHRPFFSLTQVLHQELVLRGLLLGALSARISSRGALALGVALAFAGLHPLLSWWRWDVVLPLTTGLTLFAFALATNLLFLRAGHIGFAFAVHAAWNLHRFGTSYGRDAGGRPISEWQSFAWIEGSSPALAAAAGLLAIVVVLEWQRPRGGRADFSGRAAGGVDGRPT